MKTRRTLVLLAVIIGLPLLAWVGFGWLVSSRNRFPPLELPAPIPPPSDNVYEQYIECIRTLRGTAKLLQLEKLPNYGSVEEKRALLEQNFQVLQGLQAAVGRPCGVTHVDPQPGDPVAEDYRHLARLIAVEGKLAEQRGHPDRALGIYLDGLTYGEDIMRGGTTLHFTQGYLAEMVLFQAMPQVVSRLSVGAAAEGAARLDGLLTKQYPLQSIFEQQYRTSMEGWQRGIRDMSRRGFRLSFPKSPIEREFLFLPKQPFVIALSDYLKEWIEQAKRPYPHHEVVEYPSDTPGVSEMAVHDSSTMENHFARYTYKNARLRLLYTALRLQAYRQEKGRYPAKLDALGKSPWFTDPFSDRPLVYRSQGTRYVLYSVGPNGQDDGGKPFLEGKLRPGQEGDLSLVPTLLPSQLE